MITSNAVGKEGLGHEQPLLGFLLWQAYHSPGMTLIFISTETITKEREKFSKNLISNRELIMRNNNLIVKLLINDERKLMSF